MELLKGTSQEKLSILSEMFETLKQSVDVTEILRINRWDQEFKSHVKKCLYEKAFGQNILRFELLRFNHLISTPLHTHPHYVVDEVVQGSLFEELYQRQNNSFQLHEKQVRTVGSRRELFDVDGSPHKVRALSQKCISLCLSFGGPRNKLFMENLKENQ